MPAADPDTRFMFTEARLKALPTPTSGRVRYRDLGCPGLFLYATPTGRVFYVRSKSDGRSVEIRLDGWPTLPMEAARKRARAIFVEGTSQVVAARRAIRSEMTLSELFADYMESHAKPRKRSWEGDESLFRLYLTPWKARRLSDLTLADVQRWHGAIGRDHGHGAANRAHSLLRKVFNFARLRGWQGGNPAVGVLRFTERSRDRFLDGEELRQFFVSLTGETERTARDFFLLALLIGARRANVLGMRWEDLDLNRGLWRIPGEKSKNGEALVVILAPQVVGLLQERKEMSTTSPWVLPSAASESGHYTEPKMAWARILARAELNRLAALIATAEDKDPEQASSEARAEVERVRSEALARRMPRGTDPLAQVIASYRKHASNLGINPDEAKMRDLRIHDLRRTLGSWQAAHGASLSIIGRSLGHKQVQTTAIYARLSLDPVRESVEKAANSMLAFTASKVAQIQ